MKRQCDKLYSINAEGKYRKGETREAYITFFLSVINSLMREIWKWTTKKILCLGNISAMNGSFWSVCRKSECSFFFSTPLYLLTTEFRVCWRSQRYAHLLCRILCYNSSNWSVCFSTVVGFFGYDGRLVANGTLLVLLLECE